MKASKHLNTLFVSLLILSLVLAACSTATPVSTEAPIAAPTQPIALDNPSLILATTTSTQDSGLLDILVPDFQEKTGYTVKTVAVGSGEAMKMGQECNADVLLVHSPAAEKEFMSNNYGSDRRLVMHNDFIIVGPASDPAGIKGLSSSTEAFTKIADSQSPFISRGDDSGTYSKEKAIWKAANLTPEGEWYLESGQGMGATLTIASEQEAYTLTDRATYLANKDNYQLDNLVEVDAGLLNVYHVIVVNPDNCSSVNNAGAIAFADYVVSPDTQSLIGSFGTEKYGQPLFTPDAGKDEATLGK
ncbi:MAG: tungsten ABC transporter substrate-binding protein [Chloroflexi bacterium RBG_19FT_COMBO_47_9]|nr:MAG: tungsten ABC transporter substrate-binding protein [Chloroflexi bacterium RBG_19FT_COMBO_47_9]